MILVQGRSDSFGENIMSFRDTGSMILPNVISVDYAYVISKLVRYA